MGLLDYFGASKDVIDSASNLYTTDKARLDAEGKLVDVLEKPGIAQLEVNRIYAASSILFNSGWIPLIGWTAGFLVLLFYAPQITIITYVWGKQCIQTGNAVPFPMQPDAILNLIYLLFGMGGLGIVKKKLVG